MKTAIVLAALLQPVALDTAPQTGKSFSNFLKQKITPRSPYRGLNRRRKKRVMEIKVKIYSARGMVVDLRVNCRKKNILLTYNKVDKKFCTPKFRCHNSLRAAIMPFCSR